MIEFLFGALAMLAVVTFAPPHIAAMPSLWLRRAWDWFRGNIRPGGE